MDLNTIITNLESYGLTDIILPFILIFTIVYGILDKINIFKKRSNLTISFVMGLTTVTAHVFEQYPHCWDVVVIINNSLPKIGILIFAIISFLIVLATLGVKLSFFSKYLGWIAIGAVCFVIYTFFTSGGNECYNYDTSFLTLPWTKYLALILVFILIIIFVTKKNKSDEPEDPDIY